MDIKQFDKTLRMPEIVVFQHVNFEGIEFRTNLPKVRDIGRLTQMVIPNGIWQGRITGTLWDMNDKISSIIVVSGVWQFYMHNDFKNKIGPPLEPGYYPWVGNIDIPNDQISSFECIKQTKL